MMDPKMQDRLLAKVGGKFKLAVLIQKRMRELVRGMPPLALHDDPTDLWGIVSKEIMEDKVDLITGEAAEKIRREIAVREAEELEAKEARESKDGKHKDREKEKEEPKLETAEKKD